LPSGAKTNNVVITKVVQAPTTGSVTPTTPLPPGTTATSTGIPLFPETAATATTNEWRFSSPGYTNYGNWHTEALVSPISWRPGSVLSVNTKLKVTEAHLTELSLAGFKADGFCLLVTAERTFDANGVIRLSSDERMSTLLTPTGLAIEGGIQGAVTNRFGYGFRTPVDEYVTNPLALANKISGNEYEIAFSIKAVLPSEPEW
jgi:hypothetical protein